MSMSIKPLVLIVTGAWHPPKCYADLEASLAELGYECLIPQHATMGHGTEGLTWEADKAKIIETATPYFDQGREIVLLAHSYGGVPAGASTEGQGVSDRAKAGKKGGFAGIIFMAAFSIPVKGWDILTTFGGTWPDWQNTAPVYTKNQLATINEKARTLLYCDATEEDAERVYNSTIPHSQDAFETGCNFVAADITIPKTYLICETDKVFPLSLQEQLVAATPGMKEARISGGHCLFVGKAPETARKVADIIEGLA